MAVHANIIANEFIALAHQEDKQLTNMQLQKLVYIAQGYNLALLNQCLYFNNTHAWQWGPVVPNLYKKLQQYGPGIVANPITIQEDIVSPIPTESKEIITAVWDSYGSYTGGQLSSITHQSDSPWSVTWAEKHFSIIPIKRITAHYLKKVRKS